MPQARLCSKKAPQLLSPKPPQPRGGRFRAGRRVGEQETGPEGLNGFPESLGSGQTAARYPPSALVAPGAPASIQTRPGPALRVQRLPAPLPPPPPESGPRGAPPPSSAPVPFSSSETRGEADARVPLARRSPRTPPTAGRRLALQGRAAVSAPPRAGLAGLRVTCRGGGADARESGRAGARAGAGERVEAPAAVGMDVPGGGGGGREGRLRPLCACSGPPAGYKAASPAEPTKCWRAAT